MGDITDFFVAGQNMPFLVAACLVAAIFLLEGIALVLGHSFATQHGDIDYTLDANGNGIPDYLETGDFNILGWLNPGHVPSMIFLLLFCGTFTITGYAGQWIFDGITGHLAPSMLAGPVALAISLPFVRSATRTAERIIPKDESSAVTVESLTGDVGVVTAGPINSVRFGMARFTDKWGTDHNLMVSSEGEEMVATGASVVLVGPHPDKAIAFVVRKV